MNVPGAKNSILPILCISCLKPGKYVLNNVVLYADVQEMLNYLTDFNIVYSYEKDSRTLSINSICMVIPDTLRNTASIRSVYYFYSVLIHHKKIITYPYPSGCQIGNRAIDLHLDFFKQMNIKITQQSDRLILDSTEVRDEPLNYTFNRISVGATINALFASVFKKNQTVLNNCSTDPYILNVLDCLRVLGVSIYQNNRQIRITPFVDLDLEKYVFQIIPDPIIAGTYILLSAIHNITTIPIFNVIPAHLGQAYDVFRKCGILSNAAENATSTGGQTDFTCETREFPGFYTDLMPLMAVYASTLEKCSIQENIMDNRFEFTKELQKLGFQCDIKGSIITISKNVFQYESGITLNCTDLRGGMAILMYVSLYLKTYPDAIIYLENFQNILRGYVDVETLFLLVSVQIKYNGKIATVTYKKNQTDYIL